MSRIASYIDHTLVHADATPDQIARLCQEACEHRFAAVAVNEVYVHLASRLLRGTGIAVACAIGFPLGGTSTWVKWYEARSALREGANELDVMIYLGALKGGHYDLVEHDLLAIVRLCHDHGALCKAILECALLTEDEKVRACQLAVTAGVDFVKTSTGYGPSGANVHDVALLRRMVPPTVGVKAAGGIRTYSDAIALLEAGATRLGVSAQASLQILSEERLLMEHL
ncbi:MAG: deoxyribose-phosphate aldolase [Anaerolineae bacterium]